MASPPISGTFNFYPFFFFSFFGKIIRVFWFIAIPPIVLNIQIYRFDRLVWLCYMEEEGEERFFGLLHPGEKKKEGKQRFATIAFSSSFVSRVDVLAFLGCWFASGALEFLL